MPKTARKPAKKAAPEHKCEFCSSAFARESTLMSHVCEQRRRHLDRNEQNVKLGFWVYQRFYKRNYRNIRERTFEDFRKSSVYLAFCKFGRYLLDINAVNVNAFIDFILDGGIPVDQWTNSVVYETYLRELNKKETPEAALERNFLLMQQWADHNSAEWTDFFRQIAPPLATLWIRTGRISPWVLYTASSAAELFARMTDEQMSLVEAAIEPKFWMKKLEAEAAQVAIIREELDAAGL